VKIGRELREHLLPQSNATLWSSSDENVTLVRARLTRQASATLRSSTDHNVALALHRSIVADRALQRTLGL
jgi:hypothetical protein